MYKRQTSNSLAVTTSTGSDTQVPTAPGKISSSNLTSSSVTLTWTTSTDNVGVVSYEVYNNGASLGSVTATTFAVSGLTANTVYTFTVKAKDAAGNISAASTALVVKTTSAMNALDDEAALSISTYPNPCTDRINIQLNRTGTQLRTLEIVDFSGKQILKQETRENTFELNTEALAYGFYILIITEGNSVTKAGFSKR